jgi:hypothetical protein
LRQAVNCFFAVADSRHQGDFIMWLRFLVTLAAMGCFCHRASGDNTIGNAVREWQVSYDASENLSNHPGSHRDAGAIRLQIYRSGSDFKAKIWLFTVSAAGKSLLGKADNIDLEIQGSENGRNRIGFRSTAPIQLKDINNNNIPGKKIRINGVWQPGRNTSDRSSQRVQLKINYNPGGVNTATSRNCDDDPDTDVLEEGDAPPDDNGAPPDP